MSGQQRRPYGHRGGRGRGGYSGQNRGGNSENRGVRGYAPQQFQPNTFNSVPPNYPPRLLNTNQAGLLPPPLGGGGQTVREETTTTRVTAEGKTEVITTVKITNESGQAPGLNPNAQFQGNPPPPVYPGQYQNPLPVQHGTGHRQPMAPHQFQPRPTYNDRPASGRPPARGGEHRQPYPERSRGHPRGRGGSARPSNQGAMKQPRSGSKERKAVLQDGNKQKGLSLADIAIDDGNDPADETQTPEVEEGVKNQSQKKENVADNEASLREVLSGLDDIKISGDATTEENNEVKDKSVSKDSRKKRPPRGNQKACGEDKNVDEDKDTDHTRKTSESDESSNLPGGPSLEAVFDFMVKEMNGKGSPEEVWKKSDLFPSTFNSDMVEQWFKRFYKKFKSIVRDGHVVLVLAYDHEMNYCLDYISRRSCKKDHCQRYHICKDYLCGHCKFGSKCSRSHHFFDKKNENLSLSQKHGYTRRYTNQDVLAIMQCRYPHICHDWNQEKNCSDANCNELHMCEKFLLGRCENDDDCTRCTYGHDRLSDHNKPIVEAYGMTKWNDVNFRRIIFIKRTTGVEECEAVEEADDATAADSGMAISGENTVDVSKTDEEVYLCDQYLTDKCDNKKCDGYHNKTLRLPYLWQVKIGNQWIDCSQSEEIEKEFCARNDKSEPFYVIEKTLEVSELVVLEFYPSIKAKLLDAEARRLSTKSYKEKGSNFRTQWRWYKEDSYGNVQLFEPDTLQHTLESKYLAGQKEYQFLTSDLPYIDFTAMCLVSSGSYSKVLRRPLLVTGSDITNNKRPPILCPDVSVKVQLPRGWAAWDANNEMELVKLSQSSPEYELVDGRFFEHLKRDRLQIKGIFRVQNYTLWDHFTSKEQNMKTALQRAKRHATALNKRYLFHGTETFDAVKGICRSNIDPRRSGKNDTKFGEGAYFAGEARLAHQYTLPPDRFVFMVNVLVGEFCKGERSYKMPPPMPDSEQEYDSCVDDVNTPMKFILFDRNQYYPEFLVWYHDAREDF